MNIAKRLALFLLSFALLVQATAFAASTTSAAGAGEAKAILESLGILKLDDEQPFDASAVVTRAGFAGMVVSLMGYDESMADASRNVYQDVTVEHSFYSDVAIITNVGLMNGYDNSHFGPDDPVTYGQALKVLVSALGYDIYAQQRGGYPTGYFSTAQQLGIMRGFSTMPVSDSLLAGAAVQLICNVLEIDIMEKVAYGSEDRYVVQEGETLLTNRLDIYVVDGVLEDNGESRLNGASVLPNDRVEIGGIVCNTGKTNAADYLGYYVKCYAQYDEPLREYTLLYAAPYQGKNEALTIRSENLVPGDSFTSFTVAYANKTGKVQKATLNRDVDIIYNGAASLNYTVDTLQPAEGYLTLIDNNADGDYDVVLVNAYDTYIVEKADSTTNTIYGKYGQNIVLDLDDTNVRTTMIDEAGSAVKLNAVKEGDVLSVQQSEDHKLIKVNVVSDVVTGIINEVTENGDRVELMIEGIGYMVSQNYLALAKPTVREIRVGDIINAKLDVQGKIADISLTDETKMAYGFVSNKEGGTGISSDKVTFRVMTTSGEFVNYPLAKRVTLNGVSVEAAAVLQQEAFKDESGWFVPQLIKYKINSAGNLNIINTAVPAAETDNDEELLRAYAENQRMTLDSKIFSLKYAMGKKTIGFMVPAAKDGGMDESKMGVAVGTSIFNGLSPLNISIYDLDAAQVIGAAVAERPGGFTNYTEKLIIVSKMTKTVNEDGMDAYKVYGYSNGAAVNLVLDDIEFYDLDNNKVKNTADLKEGDVVRLSKDFSGEYMQGSYMLSLEGKQEPFRRAVIGSDTDRYPERWLVSGMAYGYSDPFISVTHDNGETYIPHEIDWDMITYVYDTQAPKGQKVRTGAIGDLIPAGEGQADGSWVILYNCWAPIKELIILK